MKSTDKTLTIKLYLENETVYATLFVHFSVFYCQPGHSLHLPASTPFCWHFIFRTTWSLYPHGHNWNHWGTHIIFTLFLVVLLYLIFFFFMGFVLCFSRLPVQDLHLGPFAPQARIILLDLRRVNAVAAIHPSLDTCWTPQGFNTKQECPFPCKSMNEILCMQRTSYALWLLPGVWLNA